uniref:Uncharacterized protein n=1 Tax=Panagrolaimus davidi TaxID=227884 RepID=A0A914P116_9BILA
MEHFGIKLLKLPGIQKAYMKTDPDKITTPDHEHVKHPPKMSDNASYDSNKKSYSGPSTQEPAVNSVAGPRAPSRLEASSTYVGLFAAGIAGLVLARRFLRK